MSQTIGHILYAGTYERDYPRNALAIAVLRRAGYRVSEVHRPVWERTRDKTGDFVRPGSLARVALRLAVAYAGLLRDLIRLLPSSDAVVIGYIGQADMLVLGPVARLFRKPVIFNPLVTLTDTLVEDRALVRPGSLAARALTLVDRVALALATVVVVDTEENGHYLAARFGVSPRRVAVVPVGADEALFRPVVRGSRSVRAARGAAIAPPVAIGRSLGDNRREAIRVLFYGKFIPLHGIDTILRAAARLGDDGDITFEIVGTGQLSAAMHRLARDLALDNVDFVPWVPLARLRERMAASDVVLGIFGDTEKAARVVPNKVFQAMAVGAAIVTRDSPAVRRVLRDGESALLVPPADPEALAAALRRLRDPALRDRLGRGARRAFDETGSLAALARGWGRAVERATGRGRRRGWGR